MIRWASRLTTSCIWAISSSVSVKKLCRRGGPAAGGRPAHAPGAQLPLDVLSDQPAERLEAKLHVGAEPGERTRIHSLLLRGAQQGLEICLDLLPGELVPDPAGEVADLQEVDEALEPDATPALAHHQLEGSGVRHEQHLGQGVHVEVAVLLEEALQPSPRPRVLAAERSGRLRPEPLQVEEVQVEDPLERRDVPVSLTGSRRARDGSRRGRRDRVSRRPGGRRSSRRSRRGLRSSQDADELEDPVVHAQPRRRLRVGQHLVQARLDPLHVALVLEHEREGRSTSSWSSRSAFRSSSARAQSRVSEIDGASSGRACGSAGPRPTSLPRAARTPRAP